jgi:hypothetical protein
MNPSSYTKQPSEKRLLAFDLSLALISGDTIAAVEAKIFNEAGQDLSATMIAGSSKSDTVVYVWVQAGSTDLNYYLRVKATTALGEIIEDDLLIRVVEKYK